MNELQWTKRIWRWLMVNYPESGLRVGRERRLWDNTRVDILTDELAIEVDWAYKYAEGIGQSLLYRIRTGRKPGVCLLVRDFKREREHIHRCETVCVAYDITLWLVDVDRNQILIFENRYDLPVPVPLANV